MVVNKLHRALPAEDWVITVVDRDDIHDYQPGYLFMAFGTNSPRRYADTSGPSSPTASTSARPRSTASTPQATRVYLDDGRDLTYDQLVIATGTTPRPDQTPGTLGPQWHHEVGEFYTYEGALATARPAGRVQRRPPRRAHHRDADQVPCRAPGVHLPGRRLPHQAGSARPHRDRLRHPARRRLHQAGGERGARLDARAEGRHRRARLHDRADRPGPEGDRLLRRARGRLRPARHHPAQHGRRLRGPLRPGRRAQLRAGRQAHDAVDGAPGDLGAR